VSQGGIGGDGRVALPQNVQDVGLAQEGHHLVVVRRGYAAAPARHPGRAPRRARRGPGRGHGASQDGSGAHPGGGLCPVVLPRTAAAPPGQRHHQSARVQVGHVHG
ncbi:unnamed protein product, partial [Ixodes pacificus]